MSSSKVKKLKLRNKNAFFKKILVIFTHTHITKKETFNLGTSLLMQNNISFPQMDKQIIAKDSQWDVM